MRWPAESQSMKKTKPENKKPDTRVFKNDDWIHAEVVVGVIAVMAIVTFMPLTHYFFAQDDIVLMYRAWAAPGEALNEFFNGEPGQFRPLSKVGYFGLMYALFGLNPEPYHFATLIFHVLNIVLFFMLMRRLGIHKPGAIVASQLFALNLAFFHVMAWISCIQQIWGLNFVLASLVLGVDAMRRGSAGRMGASLAAYVLALACVEQTLGVPILLFMIGVLGLGADKRRTLDCLRELLPHFLAMVVYVVFIVLWKGAPTDGPYEAHYSGNIPLNLWIYLGWMYEFFAVLPSVMVRLEYQATLSHVVFGLLAMYHLFRRRFRWLAFSLAFFLVSLLPASLLVNHTFFLHTYIPSFGMLLLIALAVDDVFRSRVLRRAVLQIALLAVLMIGTFAVSYKQVRNAQLTVIQAAQGYLSSFVLRRARIAEKTFDALNKKSGDTSNVRQVYLVYGREEGREEATWNVANFRAAIGRGKLINLTYDNPDLVVHFKLIGDTISRFNGELSRLFVYGDFGNLLTYEEANASIGTDTTAVYDKRR